MEERDKIPTKVRKPIFNRGFNGEMVINQKQKEEKDLVDLYNYNG